MDTAADSQDARDSGEDDNTESDTCESAEVSGSMKTGRCLGEKHVGPSQPRLAKYPSTKIGKQNRSFNEEWFKRFPWMEYSIPEDAVFCFPCRHFQTSSAYADNLFTERGFRQWKCAMGKDGKIMKHAESGSHVDAMTLWEQYCVSQTSGSVVSQQFVANRMWVDRNRKYLSRIIDAILFLSQQGLALRGDSETDDSRNRGNFLELLTYTASVDPQFQTMFIKMPSNATYTSPDIQNELINIAATHIREDICHDVNKVVIIAIMVDESKDVSRKEQLSLCIRWTSLPDFDVHEDFLTFRHMINVDAKSLCEAIVSILTSLGLNQCIIIAQCYDGASVMSGDVSGVQARFKQIHKNAVYVHCHAHRLNLVIVDAARHVQSASEFFSVVEVLYVFLTRLKVHEVLVRRQVEQGLVVRELGRLSDTRWACRYRNISMLDERYDVILAVLDEVQQLSDAEIRTQSRGLLHELRSYRFVANLKIFSKILSLSHGVNEALQSSTITIAESDRLITGLLTSLSDLRNDDSLWDNMWGNIERECNSQGIELPSVRRQAVRERPDMIYSSTTGRRQALLPDHSTSLRVELLIPALDRILSELQRRFSDQALSIIGSLASLLCPSSSKFFIFEDIRPLLSTYGEVCNINESLLTAEMTVALNLVTKQLGDKLPQSDLQTVLKLLVPSVAFPNLLKCVQIALTLPVTSASCERSFSAMNLIKTYLRNRTEDVRLSDLAILFVHKERARVPWIATRL